MSILRFWSPLAAAAPLRQQARTAIKRAKPPGVMLAHSYKNQDVSGWYYSEKMDGIRAFWTGSKLQTRNGVVLNTPKEFVQGMRKYFPKQRVDGELFMGKDLFQQTMGAVMRHSDLDKTRLWHYKSKAIKYVVFDLAPNNKKEMDTPFDARLAKLAKVEGKVESDRIEELPAAKHISIIKYKKLPGDPKKAVAKVQQELKQIIGKKGEGLMLRAPQSLYVEGRSPDLLKVKEVEESEALVLDWQEGTGKHSGLVGALRCRLHNGIHFEVGTGLTDSFRFNPSEFMDKVITVRHQGVTDFGVPRFPVFIGLRLDRSPDEFDLLSAGIDKLAASIAQPAGKKKPQPKKKAKKSA